MKHPANLQTLCTSLESLKDFGVDLSGNVEEQVAAIVAKHINSEILPAVRNTLEPLMNPIPRALTLVVAHRPGEPLAVLISHTSDLTDLTDADLTPDAIPEMVRRAKQPKKKKPSEKTQLRVTTPDGRIFYDEHNATETFCRVLQHLGLQRVRSLNIMASGINIVSTSKDPNRRQRPVDQFFIFTNSSTTSKANQLREISERLNAGLKIETF